jgi:hypothetical protein
VRGRRIWWLRTDNLHDQDVALFLGSEVLSLRVLRSTTYIDNEASPHQMGQTRPRGARRQRNGPGDLRC